MEHEDAIECDLQRALGLGIDNIGDDLSWRTLSALLMHLPLSSALAREINNESASWDSTLKTNFLLADLIDVLQAIDYHLVGMSGAKPKKPAPYPRPGKVNTNKKHYGKDAIRADKLESWFRQKSKR